MSNSPLANLQRLEQVEAVVALQAARIEALERIIAGLSAVFGGGGAEAADESELDSKFGDPPVKKDPTDQFWRGVSFVNKRLSECPAEYLDAFAKYKELCAKLKEKDGTEAKKKYAAYDRADAARARGWARRLRAGWTPRPTPEKPTFGANGSSFGAGTTRSWGSNGDSFSNGSRRFLGGGAPPPPLAPSPPVPSPSEEDYDFPFGANVNALPAATAPTTEDLDDDPPL